MNPFTTNYFDLTPTDIADLSEQLLEHPVIVAQAEANSITPATCISEALAMWRSGELKPVHDNEGRIVGFS